MRPARRPKRPSVLNELAVTQAKDRARASWRPGTCVDCAAVGPVVSCGADLADRCRKCLLKVPVVPAGVRERARPVSPVLMDASSPVWVQCPICNARFDAVPDAAKGGRRPEYCSAKCRRVQERRVAAGRRALGRLVAQSAGPRTVEQIDAAVAQQERAAAELGQRYTAVAEEFESVRAAVAAGKDPSGRGGGVLQELTERRDRLSRDLAVACSRRDQARVWAIQAKAALERGAATAAQVEAQLNVPLEVF